MCLGERASARNRDEAVSASLGAASAATRDGFLVAARAQSLRSLSLPAGDDFRYRRRIWNLSALSRISRGILLSRRPDTGIAPPHAEDRPTPRVPNIERRAG